MSRRFKDIFFILGGVLLGTVVSLTTTLVLAHGGDTSKVHSCVKNSTLLPGAANVRIVSATTNCNSNETALDWDKNAASSSANFGLPFMCNQCNLTAFADKFAGHDFSYAQILKGNFDGGNFTGVNFSHARLSSSTFQNSIFANANLSYAEISGSNQVGFQNADLTSSNLSHSTFSGFATSTNFTGADFSNAAINNVNMSDSNFSNTNFSNTTFDSVNMTNATNAATATFTGVTWTNVTCPDGTNSDDNSNTCAGHLTP